MSAFTEAIEEELTARGWDRDKLTTEMTKYDWGINRLVVDLMLVDEPMPGLILGDETRDKLAKALGMSPEFIANLYNSSIVEVPEPHQTQEKR